MKHILLLLLALPLFSIAQTGPGGVGSSTTNSLWLQADDISQADNTSVASWLDKSGNSNGASQSTAGYRPSYQTSISGVNGHDVVRFDGTDDYFDDAHAYSTRTIFAVYNILSAYQKGTDLGQLWGDYDNGVHVALDGRTTGLWSFDGVSSSNNKGKHALNGGAYSGSATGSSNPAWVYNQFDIVAVELDATRALSRQVIGSLYPHFSVGLHQYGGDIAELIVYNNVLNDAQRIIVENYLAARYDLTITNDYYANQASHPNDVAGIGRETAAMTHTTAMSDNVLELSNPSGLDDGEYLLFGHDDGDITTAWTTTETPNAGADIKRLAREWRFSEMNGDVGTVDLLVDVSTLPALPGGNKYGIMIDSDGNFSSGAIVYEIAQVSGTNYNVIGINITDGDYVAICTIDPKVSFSNDVSDDFEINTSASMSIELNYIPRNNVTVEYTTADGSASAAQPDYTAVTASVATINAGSTSMNISISITDDAVSESDETFTVTLSNPIAGVTLGNITVHTYTIHDDENSRKIYYNVDAASGDEGTSSINVDLTISTSSATDVSIDYHVIGGTATEGAGDDYILSSGTVTIVGGSGLTAGSFSFTVNDDALYEGNETINIKLNNPVGCDIDLPAPDNIGTGYSTYTYTINDNEPIPEIQFSSTTGSGSEASSPASITVELNSISTLDASVNYTVANISAINGSDYSLANGSVTIPAGSSSVNILASIIDDAIEELTETFKLTLSSPTNAILGANTVYTYSIDDNDISGHSGPGGVGSSSNNKLWLSADDIAQSDGTSVTSWADKSGNSNDASQSTAGYKPSYQTVEVNGHDVVRFDGTDDYFDDSHSYDARTVFIVYNILSDNQNSELGQIWGNYAEGVHIALDGRSEGQWSFDGDKSASNQGKHALNGAAYSGFASNSASPVWTYNQFDIVAVEFNATQTLSRQVLGSLVPAYPVGDHQYGGDIAELIVYNSIINDAQRIILENYLAAKYGLTISNDIFAHEATYGNEVAGIGKIDINNFNFDAQGTAIVRIFNPTGLDNNEYLIWGHDNGLQQATETTDIPTGAGVEARFTRVWRASEVNGTGTAVDVGAIDINFDLTGLGDVTASDLRLLVDSDNDGTFSDETPISGATDVGSNVYQFAGVTAIANNLRFTLATINADQTPLPIELLSFTASNIDNRYVKLDWQTATEINNDYFSIERSNNGKNWKEIAKLTGAGNSNTILNYSIFDRNPLYGTSYYRLKQTDFDGQFSFSQTRYISIDKGNTISIYPNPTEGLIAIESDDFELKDVIIYNILGQDVSMYTKVVKFDATELVIDLSNLNSGMYIVKIKTYVAKVYKK